VPDAVEDLHARVRDLLRQAVGRGDAGEGVLGAEEQERRDVQGGQLAAVALELCEVARAVELELAGSA
jgi:hypothetical protein